MFNPSNIAHCYDQLFSEGVSLISEQALNQALDEMATQGRELMYARDILRVIESEAAASLLAGLKEGSQAIETLKDEINKDWLRDLIENDDQAQMHVATVSVLVSMRAYFRAPAWELKVESSLVRGRGWVDWGTEWCIMQGGESGAASVPGAGRDENMY